MTKLIFFLVGAIIGGMGTVVSTAGNPPPNQQDNPIEYCRWTGAQPGGAQFQHCLDCVMCDCAGHADMKGAQCVPYYHEQ